MAVVNYQSTLTDEDWRLLMMDGKQPVTSDLLKCSVSKLQRDDHQNQDHHRLSEAGECAGRLGLREGRRRRKW